MSNYITGEFYEIHFGRHNKYKMLMKLESQDEDIMRFILMTDVVTSTLVIHKEAFRQQTEDNPLHVSLILEKDIK